MAQLCQLPEELLLAIFRLVPTSNLVNISLVCKKWKRLATDFTLFHRLIIDVKMKPETVKKLLRKYTNDIQYIEIKNRIDTNELLPHLTKCSYLRSLKLISCQGQVSCFLCLFGHLVVFRCMRWGGFFVIQGSAFQVRIYKRCWTHNLHCQWLHTLFNFSWWLMKIVFDCGERLDELFSHFTKSTSPIILLHPSDFLFSGIRHVNTLEMNWTEDDLFITSTMHLHFIVHLPSFIFCKLRLDTFRLY